MKSQLLIAAPHSGSGKTTVTLGLLRALARRGTAVQPYKCGPDYIDTFHHGNAAGRPSVNLDTFMASEAHVGDVYAQHLERAEVGIVEGVMGLFDGARKAEGSSAAVAELLDLPVILVVSAKAMAYSAAALLYGFSRFNPKLNIAGVIFNHVNSASHYRFLQDACADVGLTALGHLPRNKQINVPSRHLGLCISDEHDYESMIEAMADHIERHLDLDLLLRVTQRPAPQRPIPKSAAPETALSARARPVIAVARDAAFNFTYHQNLKQLEQLGKVIEFSPLSDSELPRADLIYLAGGYPELHLSALSENTAMRQALAEHARQGGRMLAECGGMMYLSRDITDNNGVCYPMCGVLDHSVSLENMKLHLGYRIITLPDLVLRGHEFHYSQLPELSPEQTIAEVETARGKPIDTPVWRKDNVLASYIHFYWGEDGALPRWLLAQQESASDVA